MIRILQPSVYSHVLPRWPFGRRDVTFPLKRRLTCHRVSQFTLSVPCTDKPFQLGASRCLSLNLNLGAIGEFLQCCCRCISQPYRHRVLKIFLRFTTKGVFVGRSHYFGGLFPVRINSNGSLITNAQSSFFREYRSYGIFG